MSIKRKIQHIKNTSKSLLSSGSFETKFSQNLKEQCLIRAPDIFETAIFNFMIDFELCWGNGLLGKGAHSFEQRLNNAKTQSENFYEFCNLLEKLNFPISWAVISCMLDPFCYIEKKDQFQPSWSKENWYDTQYTKMDDGLWNGKKYLDSLKNNNIDHEILSHGYHHIDYSDPCVNTRIAKNDIMLGINKLNDYDFKINGFVFPCNKVKYTELLNNFNIDIIRGDSNFWEVTKIPIQTPIGTWISPSVISFKEIKKLIDIAVTNKAFFHPWMHLIECDNKQKDIENFYRPLFLYIHELQDRGKIKNMSFNSIYSKINN